MKYKIFSTLITLSFFFCLGIFFTTNVNAADTPLETNVKIANPSRFKNLEELISSASSVIRPAFIILFAAMVLYGAVLITTARGNDEQVALAKKTIGAAAVGFSIAVFAPTIVDLALSIVGVEGFGTLRG